MILVSSFTNLLSPDHQHISSSRGCQSGSLHEWERSDVIYCHTVQVLQNHRNPYPTSRVSLVHTRSALRRRAKPSPSLSTIARHPPAPFPTFLKTNSITPLLNYFFHRFGKALAMRPADASLYLARSRARERAGNAREAVLDAAVGVCLRPRVAAGFVRLSAAFEAQGRHASAVRVCFLVRPK